MTISVEKVIHPIPVQKHSFGNNSYNISYLTSLVSLFSEGISPGQSFLDLDTQGDRWQQSI